MAILSALETVTRLYDTVISKDRDAHDALIGEDCILYEPESHPISEQAGVNFWKGRHETAATIARLKEFIQPTRFEVQHFLSDGKERVVCLYNMHGLDSKGQPYSMPMAEAFLVRDGQVVEIRPYYWDIHQLRKLTGHG